MLENDGEIPNRKAGNHELEQDAGVDNISHTILKKSGKNAYELWIVAMFQHQGKVIWMKFSTVPLTGSFS